MHGAAEQAGLELLIGADAGHVYYVRAPGTAGSQWPIGAVASRARNRASDKAAVVAPVETEPWPALPRLILQMGRLVEYFVVVNAKGRKFPGHCNNRNRARPADLRSEES